MAGMIEKIREWFRRPEVIAREEAEGERPVATPPAGMQFTDAAPPSGRVVCYRVRAINAAGESAYSNVARMSR